MTEFEIYRLSVSAIFGLIGIRFEVDILLLAALILLAWQGGQCAWHYIRHEAFND